MGSFESKFQSGAGKRPETFGRRSYDTVLDKAIDLVLGKTSFRQDFPAVAPGRERHRSHFRAFAVIPERMSRQHHRPVILLVLVEGLDVLGLRVFLKLLIGL